MKLLSALLLASLPATAACQTPAPAPTGLAATALANEHFTWTQSQTPGFRVHFLADSYPARHQDSLTARLPLALAHAREVIEVPVAPGPIDLFFVESRPQMEELVGGRATGFAQPSARAVFLMTNPDWRAFEKHEIMHVVAVQGWGPAAPGNDWLVEGLAQFADGHCGGYVNADIALALNARHGWIPFEDVLTRFRAQPDLRAYLQAASFVEYLHGTYGSPVLRRLWTEGVTRETAIDGTLLGVIEQKWRAQLKPVQVPSAEEVDRIEQKGCG